MSLRPCPACRRHVATTATSCVFCAVALAPAAPRVITLAARASRAAVFAAGAALATGATACGPEVRVHQTRRPDDGHTDPAFTQGAPAAAGSIEVLLTDEHGAPRAFWSVSLLDPAGARQFGHSAQDGRLAFRGLAPGRYRLQLWPAERHRSPVDGSWWRDVEVTPRQVTSLVLTLPREAPPPDTSHLAKPYGAPPARRRVV